jgi:hypothetical protein
MDVATRSERIDELERVANRLAEGIVERERELKRLRAELAAAGARSERMLESIQQTIKRLAGDRAPAEDVVPASSNGHAERTPAELFDGFLEVEVGPLGDFSQLVGFEDAARSIEATSEISIKRFSDGRATLEMTLREPVELLDELERRWDLEFRVRDTRDGRLILDVDE